MQCYHIIVLKKIAFFSSKAPNSRAHRDFEIQVIVKSVGHWGLCAVAASEEPEYAMWRVPKYDDNGNAAYTYVGH